MEKKQILKKLIKVYENAIDVIECVEPSGEVQTVLSWCIENGLDQGVCHAAESILQVKGLMWVNVYPVDYT